MKTRVDIVIGFLGSGKTSYINNIMEGVTNNEKFLIIQYESGEEKITRNDAILINALENNSVLSASYLEEIIKEHSADRIIIEYNGMEDVNLLFDIFEDPRLRKLAYLGEITTIVDGSNYNLYSANLGGLMDNQVQVADKIIVNEKIEPISQKTINSIKEKNKNSSLYSIDFERADQLENIGFNVSGVATDYNKKKINILDIFIMLLSIFLIFISLNNVFGNGQVFGLNFDIEQIKAFFLISISILVQAFPFMLIGMLLSSIMHVFVSNETVIKIFPTKYGLGFISAIFGGLFLPVCECAIVPVAARLVKKGVALPIAITFMLAAPIVNPIVIISTLYAFPNNPEMLVYRLVLGIIVALSVRIVLSIIPNGENNFIDYSSSYACDCIYCSSNLDKNSTLLEKIKIMFLHTGEEFFTTGKYFVVGAFIATLIQFIVPTEIFESLYGRNALSIIVLMAAAFLFSLCSTSDAFIARNLMGAFSPAAVTGFLVYGPMMDIKNLFMLLSSFKKEFVLKLAIIITFNSFIIIYLFFAFLGGW